MARRLSMIGCLALACLDCFGQGSAIVNRYLAAIHELQSISYTIERIDTFADGTVWRHRGSCLMQKDQHDALLGYRFVGVRMDLQSTNVYDGVRFYRLNDSGKTYEVRERPDKGILGNPGGQMVVDEFMSPVKNYSALKEETVKDAFVLRYTFPDDTAFNVSQRSEVLLLDPATYLPKRVTTSSIALGKKQVCMKTVSDVRMNDLDGSAEIDSARYLQSYSLNAAKKDTIVSLLGQRAPPFELMSFDSSIVALKKSSGQITLLDFWETWCGPCVASMPKVEGLFDAYRNNGFVVLGITSEEKSLESAKLLVRKKHVSYPNLIGNAMVNRAYHVTQIPKYVVIDEGGTVIYEAAGYNEDLERLLRKKFTTH